jgi:hypothetical protein
MNACMHARGRIAGPSVSLSTQCSLIFCMLPRMHACACSKLEAALAPSTLQVVNQSHLHADHFKDDGSAAAKVGETHLK